METEVHKTETEKWLMEYLDRNQPRLVGNKISLNIDNIRQANSECAQRIIQEPTAHLNLVRDWAKGQLLNDDPKKKSLLEKPPVIRVNMEGHLGANFVSPRGLTGQMANQLVGVQGLVTKMSIVRSLMSRSLQYC